MGAKVAKPNPPEENQARNSGELARQGLEEAGRNFFQSVRLGDPTLHSLGYKLTDNRLVDQELRICTTTKANAANSDLTDAVGSILSQDYDKLAEVAANSLLPFINGFLTGDVKPAEVHQTEEFAKSYLMWENQSLVQYSCYVKATNSRSLGLLTMNAENTLLVCVCKGLVDFSFVDPQVVIYQVAKAQPDLTLEDFTELIEQIEQQLRLAANLGVVKQHLTSGQPLDTLGQAVQTVNALNTSTVPAVQRYNIPRSVKPRTVEPTENLTKDSALSAVRVTG